MRTAVLLQAAGALGSQVFNNGLLLLYLQDLGLSRVTIMVALSLQQAAAILATPAAFLADRKGIKLVGTPGLLLTVVGYALIASAAFLDGPAARWCVLGGIILFSMGTTFFVSGWFGLLSGFVPENARGRFLGALRFSWQAVVILFSAICWLFLPDQAPQWMLQVVFGLIAVGQVLRLILYQRLPELVPVTVAQGGMKQSLLEVARTPHYLPFCSYVFLLCLCTGGGPMLFGLIEKQVLLLPDGQIVLLGAILMLGSLVGYACGGLVVDRMGSKFVFLMCHFGYAVVLGLFVLRGFAGPLLLVALGVLHFGFGLAFSGSSIAISTEMFRLIPASGRNLAASCCSSLQSVGAALASLLPAAALHLGLFNEQWAWMGKSQSSFDAVLLIDATLVLLLVATLGLVPSVLGPAQVGAREM